MAKVPSAPNSNGYQEEEDVLVGVLAHEMGHRPKRWGEYMEEPPVSRRASLRRHEETRADIFCAKALAELGLQVEPLVAFLKGADVTSSLLLRCKDARRGLEGNSRRTLL